jgi:hypothetical protein
MIDTTKIKLEHKKKKMAALNTTIVIEPWVNRATRARPGHRPSLYTMLRLSWLSHH